VKRIIPIALLVAFAVTLPSTLTKPCVTPDGVRHIATAQSLVAGKGLIDYDGTPAKSRPPLYSIALALPLSMGATRDDAVNFVNFACIVAIYLLAFAIVAHTTHSKGFMAHLWAVAVTLSPTLTSTANTALTEPLATALLLGLVLSSLKAREKPWLILIAAAFGVLLCLTRYAGLGVVLGLAMGTFAVGPALILALPSVAITTAFYLWAGSAGHGTGLNLGGLIPSLGEMLNGLSVSLGGAVGAVLVVFGGLWFYLRHKDDTARILIFGWAGYLVTIVFINMAVDLEMGARMVLPAVVLLILAFALEATHRWRRVLAVGLAVWGVVGLVAIGLSYKSGAGLGFNSPDWPKSRIIQGIATVPGMDYTIASNSPTAVWFHTGKVTRRIPYSDEGDSAVWANIVDGVNYWVWWRQFMANPRYVTPEMLPRKDLAIRSYNTPEALVLEIARDTGDTE
jgi:hypothetical protein